MVDLKDNVDTLSKNKNQARQINTNVDQLESIPNKKAEGCKQRRAIWITLTASIVTIVLGVAVGVPVAMKMSQNTESMTTAPSLVAASIMTTTSTTSGLFIVNINEFHSKTPLLSVQLRPRPPPQVFRNSHAIGIPISYSSFQAHQHQQQVKQQLHRLRQLVRLVPLVQVQVHRPPALQAHQLQQQVKPAVVVQLRPRLARQVHQHQQQVKQQLHRSLRPVPVLQALQHRQQVKQLVPVQRRRPRPVQAHQHRQQVKPAVVVQLRPRLARQALQHLRQVKRLVPVQRLQLLAHRHQQQVKQQPHHPHQVVPAVQVCIVYLDSFCMFYLVVGTSTTTTSTASTTSSTSSSSSTTSTSTSTATTMTTSTSTTSVTTSTSTTSRTTSTSSTSTTSRTTTTTSVTTTTTTTAVPPNLLVNPGGDASLTGWTQTGPSTAIRDTGGLINSGYNPRTGGGMFAGGLGSGGSSSGLTQNVILLGGPQNLIAAQLDAGTLKVEIKFYYQNYNSFWLSTDEAQVIVTFKSATNVVLGTADSGNKICNIYPGWCFYSNIVNLPVGTRTIEYKMNFIRNGGTDIDSYIDDASLRII
ncbi:hypothetical protein I4U23_006672 [Adineta vaga]|nr:hypothetical protein I4U23_006672 [Adineta vaga]